MPSDIKKFQSNDCKDLDLLRRVTICPPCIPDRTAPEINWVFQSEPYFDARTCEYVSVYKVPKRDLLATQFSTLSDLAETYKKEAMRLLLRHYNKLENDYTVCAFGGCLTGEEFEEYKNIFNNFYDIMVQNQQQIIDKYSGTGVSTAAVGSGTIVTGILGFFAAGATGVVGGIVGVGIIIDVIIKLILYGVSNAELEEALGEEIGDFPIEELRGDLRNLIGPDIMDGLERLKTIYGEIHPYALEWTATIPENGYLVDDANHFKFKVTVPAFNFDLIPQAPTASDDDEDEETNNETRFPDEIILMGKDIFAQKNDLLAGVAFFRLQYEFFQRIEKGRLLYKDGTTYRTFSLNASFELTKEFFQKLEEFLVENNYRFSYQFVFNLNVQLAEEVKIVFDNSDPSKPLKIKKVFAKSPYCEFEELTVGDITRSYYPTVMNYLVNLKEINNALTAQDKIEWLDFCLEYVYPPLKVDYGRNTGTELEDKSVLECLGDPANWVGENMINPLASFFSTYAYNLEQKLCKGENPIEELDPLNIFNTAQIQRQAEENAENKAKERRSALEAQMKAENNRQLRELQKDGKIFKTKEDARNQAKDRNAFFDESNDFFEVDGVKYFYTENIPDNTDTWDEFEIIEGEQFNNKLNEKVEEEKEKILRDDPNRFYNFYIQDALDKVSFDETFGGIVKFFNGQSQAGDYGGSNYWMKFMGFLGLCGVKSLTTNAIKCISKGISLQDFQEKVIKKVLKSIPLENWAEFLPGLPPDARSKIEQQMLNDFGEAFQPPWLTNDTNTQVVVSPEAIRQDLNNKGNALKVRVPIVYKKSPKRDHFWISVDNQFNFGAKNIEELVAKLNEKTTWTKDEVQRLASILSKFSSDKQDQVGNINLTKTVNLIIDAYIEALLKYVDNNLLLQRIRQLPGADAVVSLLNLFINDCEGREQKELSEILGDIVPSEGFLGNFSLNVCNPFTGFIRPALNDLSLPKGGLDVFKYVADVLEKTISKMVGELIKKIILDALRILDSALCKALEGLATAIATGDPLMETFKDVFCPDLSDDEVKDQLNKLLNGLGITDRSGPNGPIDLAACLGNALTGSVSKQEMLELLLNPNDNSASLQNMVDAINVNCPELSDILGTPAQVGSFLESMGSALPPETIIALQNALEPEDQEIMSNTICFTPEELEAYQQELVSVYEELGIPAEEAVALNYQNTLNNLTDLLNGVDNIDDALAEMLDAVKDQCEEGEFKSNIGGLLFEQPESVVEVENDLAKDMFYNIYEAFLRDFITDDDGLLSRILTDRQNIAFSRHAFLEGNFFFGVFYHNTQESADEKASFLDGINPLNGIGDRGYFPQTIGLYLKSQLTAPVQYEDGEISYKINYSPSDADQTNYGDSNHVIYKDDLGREFLSYGIEYKARSGLYEKGVVNINTDIDLSLIESYISTDTNISYRKRVFEAYLKYKLQNFTNFLKEDGDLYKNLNQRYLDFSRKLILGGENVSNGFSFGWQDEPLTPEDMNYVGPDGEEYNYDEEEKVLGRSQTNNPRVHFLNPEVYGGTYLKPAVYVDPVQYNGWMDLTYNMIPKLSKCRKTTEDIFRFSEISGYCNQVKNTEKTHKLYGEVQSENCFEEKPFDKIATNSTKGGLAAITKAMIRTIIIEQVVKSLPVLMSLEYNENNYDDTYKRFLSEKFKHPVSEIRTFFGGSPIEQENFYLAFLEQVVIDYQRKINRGEIVDMSPDVEAALEILSKVEPNYNNISHTLSRMPDGKIRKPAIGLDYIDNFDFENYNREDFIVYALRWQNLNDDMFEESEDIEIDVNLMRFFIPQWSLLHNTKMFMLRIVREQCEVILSEVLESELKDTIDHIFKNFKPDINNLSLYTMTSKDIFNNTELENIGTNNYETKISNFETISVGNVADVVTNIETSSPFSSGQDEELIIEKYIRVTDKEGQTIQEILDRDYTLRDVTSVSEFDSFMESLKENYPDKYLSELFGDAELVYPVTVRELSENNITLSILNQNSIELTTMQKLAIGARSSAQEDVLNSTVLVNKTVLDLMGIEREPSSYRGDIGLKYGIRICLKPDINSIDAPVAINQDNVDYSKREKMYYCNHQNAPSMDTFGLVLCSAEVEMLDHKVSEFSLFDGTYKYDLDCLLNKLVRSQEYKMFFNDILNIRSIPSNMAVYSNLFFIDSIGIEDDRDDTDFWTTIFGAFADWKGRPDSYFQRTLKRCRRMFATFYFSSDIVNKEKYTDSAQTENILRLYGTDIFKSLGQDARLLKSLNEGNLNPFAKRHRLEKQSPFDQDGEECDNIYSKIFS